MDDTSALPAVTTKPRPRMAAVVGVMGAMAVFLWAAAIYFAAVDHPADTSRLMMGLAVTLSASTAVVWAVWHLRSKGSLEHRLVLSKLDKLETQVVGIQVCLAAIGREVNARVRQAHADGYVDAAHDFGINTGGGDDPTTGPPPANSPRFLRPVRGGGSGGRPDVG